MKIDEKRPKTGFKTQKYKVNRMVYRYCTNKIIFVALRGRFLIFS